MSGLIYISPSIFPSQAANSTHVILQVDALSKHYDHILIVGMSSKNAKNIVSIKNEIEKSYEVSFENIDFALCRNLFGFGNNLIIALYSIRFFFSRKYSNLMTRNIYAAFLFYLIRRIGFIYETHTIEKGLRALMQKILLRSKRIQTVVISKSLKKLLIKKYSLNFNQINVLHDAARQNLPANMKTFESFDQENNYQNVLGYFGSLYPGRGIDIIEAMSKELPNSLFVIFGPNNQNLDFEERVKKIHKNIKFYGHIPHKDIHTSMMKCDILLMPYQNKVSIGKKNSDTSKWMSPMKMFEYMAACRPIISSDIVVLREVLIHMKNAILVTPDNVSEWVTAANKLKEDSKLRNNLANEARLKYELFYNWGARASELKNIFNKISI